MRGNPALTFNLTRAGETRIERTIVPDAAMGATISFIPPRNEVGPAGEDAGLGERRPDARTRPRPGWKTRQQAGTQPMARKQAARRRR